MKELERYIDQMTYNLNNKVIFLKEALKLQLYLLDHQGDPRENELFDEIASIKKRLLAEDMQFLKHYEKIFEVMNIMEINDLDQEKRAMFKPVQDKIILISELEEHFRIQADMLSDREHNIKKMRKNQNIIKAYKK